MIRNILALDIEDWYPSYLDMLFNVGLERDKVLAGGKMLPD